MGRTRTRKVFVGIAGFGASACMALIPLAKCDENWVIFLLMASNFFLGFTSGGDNPLPAELTYNFIGTLFGFTNFLSMSSGFVCPLIIGAILETNLDILVSWGIIFYMSAFMAALGAVVFIVAGSAERQAWDYFDEEPDKMVTSKNINTSRECLVSTG